MAERGWYPDPGGSPGRYRYWDGASWSAETTGDPSSPPPGTMPAGTKINDRRPFLIIGVVVLVIIAAITVLIIRSRSPEVVTDPNPPAPSVSGWNDSSPLPTASPTPSPAGGSTNPEGQVACAAGDPYATQPHPVDGRIHGGSLSIVQPGGDWARADSYARVMTWAYDVSGAREQIEPYWWAMVAVGAVNGDDGFSSPKQAADGLMQCIASSAYYQYFTGRTDEFSKTFSLDGRRGWAIRSEVRVDDPRVQAPGDVVEVVVLDTGTPGQLSFFAGFVPIGDQDRLRILDETIAGMQVQ